MAMIDPRTTTRDSPEPVLLALELHLAVREAVAEIIDHPSATGVREVVLAARKLMRFEVEAMLPAADPDQRAALEQSHRDLAGHLNVLSWHGPGSREMSAAVADFRHVLLAHLDVIGRR